MDDRARADMEEVDLGEVEVLVGLETLGGGWTH
jgi:hypothetical protein